MGTKKSKTYFVGKSEEKLFAGPLQEKRIHSDDTRRSLGDRKKRHRSILTTVVTVVTEDSVNK